MHDFSASLDLRDSLREEIGKFCRKIEKVRRLIREIFPVLSEGIESVELRDKMTALLEEKERNCEDEFSFPEWYAPVSDFPKDEDLEVLQKLVSWLKVHHHQLETELCIIRDLLVKILGPDRERMPELPKDLRRKVKRQLKEHLIHRKADREQAILNFQRLKSQLKKGNPTGDPSLETAKQIDERIKWIEQLSEEELLADRELF